MREIETFKYIESGYVFNTPHNIQFFIERVGHDINGNPKYRLKVYDYITAQKIKSAKGRGGKFYIETKTLHFTSYNLSESIKNIFEKAGIDSGLK